MRELRRPWNADYRGGGGGWILYPPLSGAAPPTVQPVGCPPAGWDRARLDGLKAAKFEIVDERPRQALATAITSCLASPEPSLRDGIAFEALTHMLRARQLDDATMRALLVDLTARLQAPDPYGFGQSFAALVLSEVARADRVQAFLTDDERVKLLVDAQHWFIDISDYRGFDDTDGWRHAVAHGSDLLMQLALNSKIDADGLRLIVSAVGAQAAPQTHAYIHGESERLARPVLFAAARGVMDEAAWGGVAKGDRDAEGCRRSLFERGRAGVAAQYAGFRSDALCQRRAWCRSRRRRDAAGPGSGIEGHTLDMRPARHTGWRSCAALLVWSRSGVGGGIEAFRGLF